MLREETPLRSAWIEEGRGGEAEGSEEVEISSAQRETCSDPDWARGLWLQLQVREEGEGCRGHWEPWRHAGEACVRNTGSPLSAAHLESPLHEPSLL